MFRKKDKNLHPILKHVPYLGSGRNKMVHCTKNPCPEAYLILPDDRWYIKSVPAAGGYLKCPKCFGEEE